jgi:hypothetical protein
VLESLHLYLVQLVVLHILQYHIILRGGSLLSFDFTFALLFVKLDRASGTLPWPVGWQVFIITVADKLAEGL